MDIVFNHCVGLTALKDGVVKRLRFGCQEKVANVSQLPDAGREYITLQNRTHVDLALADDTILKAVPVSFFRFETSFPEEASSTTTSTSRKSKTKTSPSSSK